MSTSPSLVRSTLVGLTVCTLATGCADSRGRPTGPTALQSTAPAMLAQTISWFCGGHIVSGGEGWAFSPTAGCTAASVLAATTGVATAAVTIAPTNFRSTVSGSNVRLQWEMAPDGVVSFLIEAGSGPGLANLATLNTGTPGTLLDVTNVPAGSYFVRVRGVGADGIPGPPSNEIIVTVGGGPPAGVPAAPTLLRRQVSGNQVTLTWVAPAGDPPAYIIEAGASPGLSNIVVFDTGNPATALNAFAPNGLYFVRVRARNGAGIGAATNDLVVPVGVPEPPEVCGDGIDQDGDGSDCPPTTTEPPTTVTPTEPPPTTPPTTTPVCTYNVFPESRNLTFAGGTFGITVTTSASNCAWTASVTASPGGFLTVQGNTSFTGTGTAQFAVATNTSADQRSGTARISWTGDGRNVAVTQGGDTVLPVPPPTVQVPQTGPTPPPQPTVTPGQNDRPDAGAGPPVTPTPTGTPANAPPAPQGSTNMSYSVQAGTGFQSIVVGFDVPQSTSRQGTMTVSDSFYTINLHATYTFVTITLPVPNTASPFGVQFAARNVDPAVGPTGLGRYSTPQMVDPAVAPPPPCRFSVGQPSPSTVGTAGGTASITVETTAGCAWSATPQGTPSSFLFVSSRMPGSGSGTVQLTVPPNSGSARSEVVRIAFAGGLQDRTISQAGCSYAVSPTLTKVSSQSQTVAVTVKAESPCPWSASIRSGGAFLSFAQGSPVSGPGTRTIQLDLDDNTTRQDRTATVRITWPTGFQDVTIVQSPATALITIERNRESRVESGVSSLQK